jgi:FkbM family methyltransferase
MNRFRYKRAVDALNQRKSDQALQARIAHLESGIAAANAELQSVRQLVGPFAASLPDGSLLCQTIHGTKYFVDPDDLVMTPHMIIYRQWEAELSRLVRQLCTPDTVFVDVGANFGYFTCLAGTLIGTGGRGKVFAFEPNPKLVGLLRRNAEINWSMAPIEIHPAAVANFNGTARLWVPGQHGANATLTGLENLASADSVEVDVVRLDDVLPADVTVDLLKIDVEGHELDVLLGAKEVIARSPKIRIVMEWSVPQIHDAGIDPAAIVRALAGFTCRNAEAMDDPNAERHGPEWLLSQSYANAFLERA